MQMLKLIHGLASTEIVHGVAFKRIHAVSFTVVRNMSSASKTVFTKNDIQAIIPELTHSLHKGQCGRIGIIGGSKEYTGAPYFAAMTALRLGADLTHVFCTESAGTAIKCYSPDLIVHPILNDDDALEQMKIWLPRLHAVVVGPGLGRENSIVTLVREILNLLKESNKITVIDADGLHVVTEKPGILYNFKNAIITPNVMEFKRLIHSISGKQFDDNSNDAADYLSKCFKDLTVVKKGEYDVIFNGELFCEVTGGSYCRCGGQGDVLSGAVALFSFWAHLSDSTQYNLLGAYSGCYMTRCLNEVVFRERGRSMVTGDFIERIGEVFREQFEN